MMDSDVKKFNVTLEDTTYEKVALLVTYIGEYITTNDIQAIMSLPKEEKIALCDGCYGNCGGCPFKNIYLN